ncbi:SIMPL domain-containing protein [Demetria terragena]|uniref:SIMPL domain-containing protein n=1 Tax=Demetria terragena TaxID=63959 RepID=UPI000366FF32|nr:SIMPL domain-containing protein [Demetria terragena]
MEIEVDGSSVIARRPERATLTLRLGFETGDKGKALTETTTLVRRVQAAIDDFKGRVPSPTTWSAVQPITTQSWRPFNQNGEVMPQRHSANAVVLVKFVDWKALSGFVDNFGGEPGVTVQGVEWALTTETRRQLEDEVIGRAVASARMRAEAIARAAGFGQVHFTRVVDPAPGHHAAGATMMRMSAVEPNGDGIALAPEDVEVRADVHAVFATA